MIDDKSLMKEDMVFRLATLLTEDGRATTMTDALSIVYNSETYLLLQRDSTALYFQSPRYVYDFLVNELVSGKAK